MYRPHTHVRVHATACLTLPAAAHAAAGTLCAIVANWSPHSPMTPNRRMRAQVLSNLAGTLGLGKRGVKENFSKQILAHAAEGDDARRQVGRARQALVQA